MEIIAQCRLIERQLETWCTNSGDSEELKYHQILFEIGQLLTCLTLNDTTNTDTPRSLMKHALTWEAAVLARPQVEGALTDSTNLLQEKVIATRQNYEGGTLGLREAFLANKSCHNQNEGK